MTQWTFFGRILPERIPLKVGEQVSFRSEQNELQFQYQISIRIADGQFVAPVDIHSGPDDVITLKNLVEGDIRTLTDYIGYRSGISFDVDMISAICDDGRSVVFGIAIPVLQESRANQMPSIEIQRFTPYLDDIPAHMVLADFREAMRNPIGTGFFCYRAIEAMMQSMKANPTEKDDNPAWAELRRRLQIDESAIYAVKAHADYPRHGKVSAMSDADRTMVFRLTKQIISRYLEYLERGKTALPNSEFPCLRAGSERPSQTP
jgi:hypothetical protein